MGLIAITPLAGFVSSASSMILWAPSRTTPHPRFNLDRGWLSDPLGTLSGHTVGGIFGILMIGFAQNGFAAASGNPTIPNGLLFGGGLAALRQLGVEALGVAVVMFTVFVLLCPTCAAIAKLMGGITLREYVYKGE